MRSEDSVDIAERSLTLEGFVSEASLALVRSGLPSAWPATARCFFASYAYADLPLGKQFDIVCEPEHPEQGEATVAVVHAVTQQFGKSFDAIPHGWKTICVIDFPRGVPQLIEKLNSASSWGESHVHVLLCARSTMHALNAKTR